MATSSSPHLNLVVLTGAGISAESGIPTFRGEEGFWTVGSRHYHPQEMATMEAFKRMPNEVWSWYLYRFSLCRNARPNNGHLALVRCESGLQQAFTLITQNIDGLHLAAGNTPARIYEIHGNAHYVRCSENCGIGRQSLPAQLFLHRNQQTRLSDAELNALECNNCGALMRPHVLWFDEYYDEENFRFDSSLNAIEMADLLWVIGTSGATNLPRQICTVAMQRSIPITCVDPLENGVTDAVSAYTYGTWVQNRATEAVPELVNDLLNKQK